jgi:glutathione S-transferase
MITVTAFKWVPPGVRGLVRDMRVRWALEEAGLAYQEHLIGGDDLASETYRARQPFGQVPVFEEDGLMLFESGAIVLHVGARSETLLPSDPAARAKAVQWLFAALDSVGPPISQLAEIDLFFADAAWARERRPMLLAQVERRLGELAARLGDRPWLEHSFTAGDLMMAAVLRGLRHTDLVAAQPRLAAYLARAEARPAFQRTLAAHMAAFVDGSAFVDG